MANFLQENHSKFSVMEEANLPAIKRNKKKNFIIDGSEKDKEIQHQIRYYKTMADNNFLTPPRQVSPDEDMVLLY